MNKKQKKRLIKEAARFLHNHKDIKSKGVPDWEICKALDISVYDLVELMDDSGPNGPGNPLSEYTMKKFQISEGLDNRWSRNPFA